MAEHKDDNLSQGIRVRIHETKIPEITLDSRPYWYNNNGGIAYPIVAIPIRRRMNFLGYVDFRQPQENDSLFLDENYQSMIDSILDFSFQQSQELTRDENVVLDIPKDNVYVPNEHCAICQEPIPEKNSCTLSCKHSFHYSCISEWGKYKQDCPVCRVKIPVK